MPNNSAIVYVTYFENGDKKELLLRVYEYGGGIIGEDLVTEQVTIVTGEDTEDRVREMKEADVVLFDNEYMTVVRRELVADKDEPLSDVYLYVTNKTDKDIMFHIKDVKLNDVLESEDYRKMHIFAGESGEENIIVYMTQEEGILEKVEFSFHAYQIDYENRIIGENLLEGTVTLEDESFVIKYE